MTTCRPHEDLIIISVFLRINVIFYVMFMPPACTTHDCMSLVLDLYISVFVFQKVDFMSSIGLISHGKRRGIFEKMTSFDHDSYRC